MIRATTYAKSEGLTCVCSSAGRSLELLQERMNYQLLCNTTILTFSECSFFYVHMGECVCVCVCAWVSKLESQCNSTNLICVYLPISACHEQMKWIPPGLSKAECHFHKDSWQKQTKKGLSKSTGLLLKRPRKGNHCSKNSSNKITLTEKVTVTLQLLVQVSL